MATNFIGKIGEIGIPAFIRYTVIPEWTRISQCQWA